MATPVTQVTADGLEVPSGAAGAPLNVQGTTNSPPLNADGTPYGSDITSVVSVAASISVTTLKSASTARKGLTLHNDSTSACRVRVGTPATTTVFTRKMAPGEYYEVPFNYKGVVTGIWEAADGAMRVTEFT